MMMTVRDDIVIDSVDDELKTIIVQASNCLVQVQDEIYGAQSDDKVRLKSIVPLSTHSRWTLNTQTVFPAKSTQLRAAVETRLTIEPGRAETAMDGQSNKNKNWWELNCFTR